MQLRAQHFTPQLVGAGVVVAAFALFAAVRLAPAFAAVDENVRRSEELDRELQELAAAGRRLAELERTGERRRIESAFAQVSRSVPSQDETEAALQELRALCERQCVPGTFDPLSVTKEEPEAVAEDPSGKVHRVVIKVTQLSLNWDRVGALLADLRAASRVMTIEEVRLTREGVPAVKLDLHLATYFTAAADAAPPGAR